MCLEHRIKYAVRRYHSYQLYALSPTSTMDKTELLYPINYWWDSVRGDDFHAYHWQCCLDGSSKTAHRILIFSIAMGADYSFDVKNIDIWAPAFFRHNNSFIATVRNFCDTVLLADWRTKVRSFATKKFSALVYQNSKRIREQNWNRKRGM